MRFGFEYVQSALAAQGRTVPVVAPEEVKDDLVRDATEVLTSLCARLHGKRAAEHRAERMPGGDGMRAVSFGTDGVTRAKCPMRVLSTQ